VLQCVAVCAQRSALGVAVCCSVMQRVAVQHSNPVELVPGVESLVRQSSVLQRVAACCSVLQHVAVHNSNPV